MPAYRWNQKTPVDDAHGWWSLEVADPTYKAEFRSTETFKADEDGWRPLVHLSHESHVQDGRKPWQIVIPSQNYRYDDFHNEADARAMAAFYLGIPQV